MDRHGNPGDPPSSNATRPNGPGSRRLAAALFCGGGDGRIVHARRMVCVVEEALVESARLGFRTGVDGALRDDGGGSLAGVASRRLGSAATASDAVLRAAHAQRRLDAAVLWSALAGGGVRGNRASLARHWRDAARVPSGESRRRVVARALPRVGEFRGSLELYVVETELMK